MRLCKTRLTSILNPFKSILISTISYHNNTSSRGWRMETRMLRQTPSCLAAGIPLYSTPKTPCGRCWGRSDPNTSCNKLIRTSHPNPNPSYLYVLSWSVKEVNRIIFVRRTFMYFLRVECKLFWGWISQSGRWTWSFSETSVQTRLLQ
jgi:hypothetical protein